MTELIVFWGGFLLGVGIMSLFASRAYDRGYRDGERGLFRDR